MLSFSISVKTCFSSSSSFSFEVTWVEHKVSYSWAKYHMNWIACYSIYLGSTFSVLSLNLYSFILFNLFAATNSPLLILVLINHFYNFSWILKFGLFFLSSFLFPRFFTFDTDSLFIAIYLISYDFNETHLAQLHWSIQHLWHFDLLRSWTVTEIAKLSMPQWKQLEIGGKMCNKQNNWLHSPSPVPDLSLRRGRANSKLQLNK